MNHAHLTPGAPANKANRRAAAQATVERHFGGAAVEKFDALCDVVTISEAVVVLADENDNRGGRPLDVTEDEVAEACRQIQSEWTDEERHRRARGHIDGATRMWGALADLPAAECPQVTRQDNVGRRFRECYEPRPFTRRRVEPTSEAAAIEAAVVDEAKSSSTCTALIRYHYDRRQWKKMLRRWRTRYGCCCGVHADKRRVRLWQANPYCVYCGVRLRFEYATLDHVRARGRGGSNDEDNVVLACKRCNNGKAAMPIQEFAEYLRQWAERVSALAQQWPGGAA